MSLGEDRLTQRGQVDTGRMETEEDGRSRRGRPTLRWRDSVKRDLKRAEVNSREGERMGEDCNGWRRLVERAEQTM